MHRTHQPCNQIWAHPLPNGHPLGQPKGRSTTSEIKKQNKKT